MARILVVDDSNFIVKTTSEFLTADGHEVVGFGNDGQEGFQLYKNLRPDLVLLDLTMPNEGGRECLREIIAFDPSARVVIISAIREPNTISECIANGAKGYVEKPMKFRSEAFCEHFRGQLHYALTG